jgi:demethylmenaquinone methyltransferase/2-methoxy-6-polyprenyl-1,4-benzoquinol methylase
MVLARMSQNIQKMFSELPATYERVNHILTFGLDILWRKRAAKAAALAGGTRWLDACCGTGEMAVNLSRLAKNGTALYATDFSLPMLQKACQKPEGKGIHFFLSDIRHLPFPGKIFDLSRPVLVRTFAEFHRVLKTGGRFINLETSRPAVPAIRKAHRFYIRLVVRRMGRLLSGSNNAYTYLSETIPRFYPPEELADCLYEAGFGKVHFKKMLFGAVALHEARKG